MNHAIRCLSEELRALADNRRAVRADPSVEPDMMRRVALEAELQREIRETLDALQWLRLMHEVETVQAAQASARVA